MEEVSDSEELLLKVEEASADTGSKLTKAVQTVRILRLLLEVKHDHLDGGRLLSLVIVDTWSKPEHMVEDDALEPRVDNAFDDARNTRFLTLLVLGSADEVGEGRDWLRVKNSALNELRDVVEAELRPQAVIVDVLEGDTGAGVRRVAPDDARREHVAILLDVSERDIAHLDKWLRFAGDQGVEHASGAVSTTWLLLLLWADVDGPPDGVVDLNVVVEDICDLTTGAGEHRSGRSRIRLDVDSLDRVVELMVEELDVANADVVVVCRDRADCQTNTIVDITVPHNDILRALGILTLLGGAFDGDSVVEVGDVEALNQNVSAGRVYSVSVQREPGKGDVPVTLRVLFAAVKEQLAKLELALVVRVNLEVVGVKTVQVLNRDVEFGRVDEANAGDLNICGLPDVEHLGAPLFVQG